MLRRQLVWWILGALVAFACETCVKLPTVAAYQELVESEQAEEASGEPDVVVAEESPLDLAALQPSRNPMRLAARRYRADREILERYYQNELSPTRHERLRRFHQGWLHATAELATTGWDDETRRDYFRLREQIYRNLASVEAAAARWLEISPLLPFGMAIFQLSETRQMVEPIDPVAAAESVHRIASTAKSCAQVLKQITETKNSPLPWAKVVLENAAQDCETLRKTLRAWFEFYNAYDPGFTWWVRQPFADADKQLEEYAKLLGEIAASQTNDPSPQGTVEDMVVDADDAAAANPLRLPTLESAVGWKTSREPTTEDVPDLADVMAPLPNRMEPIIARYVGEFSRRGRGGVREGGREGARARGQAATKGAIERWLTALDALDFEHFDVGEQVDFIMLRNLLEHQLKRWELPREAGEEVTGPSGIRGRPIGREALQLELEREMIPYSPEELIEIALRELAWCRRELTAAARELGFGDDWRQAVEHVKSLYVSPGEQPIIVRQLSDEAVAYLRQHDLLTVPPLANETWRMRMMPVDQQLITPFFTGGEVVSVGYPTHDMTHDAKMQSMRGNNVPFSRATVHHELIPGHGLQQFMSSRYATYRAPFSTPFWTEGWALYWEMLLYDHGFVTTPADRVGFMVWRSHRCARIVFSLSFHLGLMTPGECVDYLVENVGFERLGAEGEVRRSFGGMYPPLYQAAYMVGGLQFRALHREFVQSGRMSPREFHDFILRQGRIPVAMIRLLLLNEKLSRDQNHDWKFYQLN